MKIEYYNILKFIQISRITSAHLNKIMIPNKARYIKCMFLNRYNDDTNTGQQLRDVWHTRKL